MTIAHAHSYGHNGAHNHAAEAASLSMRRLMLALGITLAFVIVEAIAGVISHSLALLTDAAHNVTDVIALALSWYAIRLALKPPSSRHTYGYHRVGILIALLNSTSLTVISLGIFWEAYQRLMNPAAVQADIMIGVALAAFVVNAGTALLVKRGSANDLNMRSAYSHLAADAVSTLGAVVAGVLIKFTGWQFLDAVVSILIGILILWNGWQIIRQSVAILLEATPVDLDVPALVESILAVEGVRGVHDLHVWSLTENMRALSAHLVTNDVLVSRGAEVQRAVNELLHHDFGIAHATLQLECADCEPDSLFCDMSEHLHHEDAQPAVTTGTD